MTCVSSGFRCTLLFLVLFVASQALAKPGNNANSTPVSSKPIKQCNKVYNNFYHTAGPNKKIEVLLQEMKKQLIRVEDDINTLKGNKTIEKEPNKTIETFLQEMKKQLTHIEVEIKMLKGNKTTEKEPNKTMETIIQEMRKQLNHVEDGISFLKQNKTSSKETNKQMEIMLKEVNKQLTHVKDDISIIKENCSLVKRPNRKIENVLQDIKKQLNQMQSDINILKGKKTPVKNKSCAELYKSGQKNSGVYTIDPDGSGAFDVFCDQTTAGGGWTVFQKRLDGSVDFYRGWADYKNGFGNLNGEFWLGLDKINRLTKTKNRLRVDLEDTTGKTAYAEYDMFAVTSEKTKYKLSLGSYSGTAGDSLSRHNGSSFTTKDQDNDSWSSNCAVQYKGAWWYKYCHHSNLNGLYHHGKHSSYADGVNWYHWKGYRYSAKRAEMKIRPVKF